MNICVVGTGYVGLVTGVCMADLGNSVACVDVDKVKIENLKKGILPIYEPGLEELVKRNKKRLKFTTSLAEAVKKAEVIFIAVGTQDLKKVQEGFVFLRADGLFVDIICCHDDKAVILDGRYRPNCGLDALVMIPTDIARVG